MDFQPPPVRLNFTRHAKDILQGPPHVGDGAPRLGCQFLDTRQGGLTFRREDR
jgi:hypothetical protein